MRIPVSESEEGYWYPVGPGYYFVQIVLDYFCQSKGYRTSTFKEFKDAFPYTRYPNGSRPRYRVKEKRSQFH